LQDDELKDDEFENSGRNKPQWLQARFAAIVNLLHPTNVSRSRDFHPLQDLVRKVKSALNPRSRNEQLLKELRKK
jgi:hypothetical protein